MNLQVGGRIQLVIVRDVKPIQYFSTLIGYVKNEYLILKAPVDDKAPVPLREGDKLTARVFSGVNVCVFDVSVLRIYGHPLFHLHVSFPNVIFGINLRTAMRVKVNIPATLDKPADPALASVPVQLCNLSITGTQIESNIEVGKQGETINLSFLTGSHPGGGEIKISTKAVIRNIDKRPADASDASPLHLYGVQFVELTPTHQIMLQNLTYQAIIEDRQKIV